MAILLIILKILLIILLVVLGIVLLVMIMPVGGDISYIDGKLQYKARIWFLNLYDSEGKGIVRWLLKLKNRPKKPKAPKTPKPAKEKKRRKKKSEINDDYYLEDFDFDAEDMEYGNYDASYVQSESVSASCESQDEDLQDKPKEKKKKKGKKSDEEDIMLPSEEDEEPEDDGKRSLGDWAELGIGIWESADRPLLKIFKGFHFRNLYIDFVTADEDAHQCALKYGKYSGMTYNIIAFMSELFTVRLKTVDVTCGFGQSKSRWDISCTVFFRAGTAVIAGLWFLITYMVRTFIPNKIKVFKKKKSAARQK